MPYTINKYNGTPLVVVADRTLNNSAASIKLPGRNYPNYGEPVVENMVWMLENFAGTTPPSYPLAGQLWWDTNTLSLKVYNGVAWTSSSQIYYSNAAPSNPANGQLWYNFDKKQLFCWDAVQWKLIGPIGADNQSDLLNPAVPTYTSIDAAIVTDNTASSHPIIRLTAGGNLIAILSGASDFTPAPGITGFTTIKPGINLNSGILGAAFNGSATYASTSGNATTLDGLTSTTFFRKDQSNSPSANGVYSLGGNLSKFAGVFANTFFGNLYSSSGGVTGIFQPDALNTSIIMGSLTNTPVALIVNNAAKLTVDTTGKVGIGTGTPSATLDVITTQNVPGLQLVGNSQAWWPRASIWFNDQGTAGRTYAVGSRNGIGFSISDESAQVIRLVIDPTGRVGINNSSPAYALDVAGDIRASGQIIAGTQFTGNLYGKAGQIAQGGNLANPGMTFTWSSGGSHPDGLKVFGSVLGDNILAYDPKNFEVNKANESKKVSVQVPTTSSLELMVAGNLGGSDYFSIVAGSASGGGADDGYVTFNTGDNGTEPFIFRQYNGTNISHELVLLDTQGDTRIPKGFYQGSYSFNNEVQHGFNNIGGYVYFYYQTGGTFGLWDPAITPGGASRWRSDPGTGNFTIYGTGYGVDWQPLVSDKRLKTNFKPITNALDKLKKINGYTFEWNDLSQQLSMPMAGTADIGVVAQELQAVMPELVGPAGFDTNPDGTSKSGENYLTVKPIKLVYLLIEALKESNNNFIKTTTDLQAQIDELKTAITSYRQ